MRIERNRCDIGDCNEEAKFRITHQLLGKIPGYLGRNIEFDLCGRHAEGFVIRGTGAFTANEAPRVR